MLPIVPFQILVPLAGGAAVLALLLVGTILLRRALVRWWTRGGERLRRRAEALIVDGVDGGDVRRLAGWLSRGRASRVRMFAESVPRVAETRPEAREWVLDSPVCGTLAALARRSGRSRLPGGRWRRIEALRAVAELQLPERGVLLEALDDPDPEVAYAAAEAIASLDYPEGARALFQRIGDASPLLDSRLATMIENMPSDVAAILAEGLGSTDPAVLYWALNLTGRKQVYELVERIRPHLAAEDPNIRVAACKCLGQLRVRLTDRWLAPLLDDEVWYVQAQAVKALGRMSAGWAADRITGLLASSHWWVRQNAVEALIELGTAAEEPVEEMLLGDDAYARNSAVEVLASVGWIGSRVVRAAAGEEDALELLEWYGRSGGLSHLENSLPSVPEAAVPTLLGILERLGDEATYGRIRAARYGMSPDLQQLCLATADRVRGR